MASRAGQGRVLTVEWKTELCMVDLGAFEPGFLIVAIEAVLRVVPNRVIRDMTIRADSRCRPLSHLSIFMTLNTGLVRMFSFEFQVGVLDVLCLPRTQQLPAQRLTRFVASFALLGKFGFLETVRVLVAGLTVLRKAEEAQSSGLEMSSVTFGASHLTVVFRQREIRHFMLERIAPADRLPINDIIGAPLVFGVALHTRLAVKRDM